MADFYCVVMVAGSIIMELDTLGTELLVMNLDEPAKLWSVSLYDSAL